MFSLDIESFRFDEDSDVSLHNFFNENHRLIYAQAKYETFKFEEDDIKNDFWSSQLYDPILESCSFDESAKLSFLDELCVDEEAETCVDNQSYKSEILVGEEGVRKYFEKGFLVDSEVLQHHGEDKELDYIFLCHKMEVNQLLVLAKCKSSYTTHSSIEVLNSNKDFSDLIATKDDKVVSFPIDPMCEEDSSYFNLDLDFEISILNDQVKSYECEYVVASFPKFCDYFSLQ